MKSLLAVIASGLFVAGVSAHDVYSGLGKGNSDVFDEHPPTNHTVAVQPSIGDSFDRYHGWADDNPDLFNSDRSGPTDAGDAPNIYQGFRGSPDLRF